MKKIVNLTTEQLKDRIVDLAESFTTHLRDGTDSVITLTKECQELENTIVLYRLDVSMKKYDDEKKSGKFADASGFVADHLGSGINGLLKKKLEKSKSTSKDARQLYMRKIDNGKKYTVEVNEKNRIMLKDQADHSFWVTPESFKKNFKRSK
jgi:hypothetical protein